MDLDELFKAEMDLHDTGKLVGKERLDVWGLNMADVVQEHASRFSAAALTCGSPSEEIFLAALCRIMPNVSIVDIEGNQKTVTITEEEPDRTLLQPQFQVGKFRVDFLITVTLYGGEKRQVVIEIDGHDFHEKTKEQVAKDKSRERVIVATGVAVLRFSGSEVFRGARKCAIEVYNLLLRRIR